MDTEQTDGYLCRWIAFPSVIIYISTSTVMKNLQFLLLPALNADGWLSLLLSVLGMDLLRNTAGAEISSDLFQSLRFFSVILLEGI